ncbi:hypothetical protein QQF64_006406 [Cirrhinus molitorella]|uniref:Uncharacterized protein n=1 Tax=Cirrhinus molitorella TaxID=172907 RepID=A0ABR3MIA4_9TELE
MFLSQTASEHIQHFETSLCLDLQPFINIRGRRGCRTPRKRHLVPPLEHFLCVSLKSQALVSDQRPRTGADDRVKLDTSHAEGCPEPMG